MLINTAILFLRECLPLFLMFAYLLAIMPKLFTRTWRNIALVLTCLVVPFSFFTLAQGISESFAGQGAEFMVIALLLVHLFCFLLATTQLVNDRVRVILVFLGVISFFTLKGSSLIFYLDIYTQQTMNWQPLLVGALIGMGICISVLVLLRFMLTELIAHRQTHWVIGLWVLFLVGNTAEISHVLLQINALDWGANTLIDISAFVDDSAEYGYLLNALVGFESSPSVLFVVLYGASLMLAIVCLRTFGFIGYQTSLSSTLSVEISTHERLI
jgi:high-affinity iron transporter